MITHRNLILFLFYLISASGLIGQENKLINNRWMVAWQPGFVKVKTYPILPDEQSYDLLLLESYIDAGYFMTKKLMIGGRAGYGFKVSGNLMDFPDVYNLGYFIRYYPYEGRKTIGGPSTVCDRCVNFRVRPYLQVRHNFTNNQIRGGENVGLDHLGVQQVGLIAGTGLRFRKNLFFNYGYGMRYSFNSDEKFNNDFIFSLEYHFGYNLLELNRNKPDCNSTWLGGIFSCISRRERREAKRPKAIIVGSSLTYINDISFNVDSVAGNYKEYSWNVNAVAYLNHRVRAGVNTIQVFSRDPLYGNKKYLLAGGIVQYEPFVNKKNPLLLEVGIMGGNYCTCDLGDPRKKRGLLYIDIGLSYEKYLFNNLYLDLGFNSYKILNAVKGKYAFNQYIVGLNYRFQKK